MRFSDNFRTQSYIRFKAALFLAEADRVMKERCMIVLFEHTMMIMH